MVGVIMPPTMGAAIGFITSAPTPVSHKIGIRLAKTTLTVMSPLQYEKQLRLHAARERMLMDGLDAASAAFDVGYESATQFNREYSRFFGQPPKRDIRTLRSPGALPLESNSNRQSAS